MTPEAVAEYLEQFELVTFDIFDTLVTRKVLHPDDVFKLLGEKVEQELGKNIDYLAVRKRAEGIAWGKYHARCSIYEIYHELKEILSIDEETANRLMHYEIELESKLIIPRRDMLKVFDHLIKCKKRVLLISDMYLPKTVLEPILKSCGYDGWEELIVSCDVGLRKDDGSLWNDFFDRYDHINTIHVGDNTRSDIQLVMDRGKASFAILSSFDLYSVSPLWESLQKCHTDSLENSLLLGMVINEGLFNSPFSIRQDETLRCKDWDWLGYAWFGPIFTIFADWLSKLDLKDTGLLFLAREGFVLQRIYHEYCRVTGKSEAPNEYFLTSRRAATVAGVRGKEDLKALICQDYKGPFNHFLWERLGIEDSAPDTNRTIHMPDDISLVMKYLAKHEKVIEDRIENERSAYLEYFRKITSKLNTKKFAVVDLGYSGTIQYSLTKILSEKIDGFYLITGPNRKPMKLGCSCKAVYHIDTIDESYTSKAFMSQLFLEAALQAPYGQLISFEKYDDSVRPRFKNDSNVPETIQHIQAGIMRFVREFGEQWSAINNDLTVDPQLAEALLHDIPYAGCVNNEILMEFSVPDGYGADGTLKFDMNKKQWTHLME